MKANTNVWLTAIGAFHRGWVESQTEDGLETPGGVLGVSDANELTLNGVVKTGRLRSKHRGYAPLFEHREPEVTELLNSLVGPVPTNSSEVVNGIS